MAIPRPLVTELFLPCPVLCLCGVPSTAFYLSLAYLFVLFVSVLFVPSLDSQTLCCPSMFTPVSSSASFPRVWHPVITGGADGDPVSFSGTCLGSCGRWAPSVASALSQSPEAGCTEGALILYSHVAFLGWDPVRPYALGLVFQFWSCPFFSNCLVPCWKPLPWSLCLAQICILCHIPVCTDVLLSAERIIWHFSFCTSSHVCFNISARFLMSLVLYWGGFWRICPIGFLSFE